jgi:PAS domain S-box-containing protein
MTIEIDSAAPLHHHAVQFYEEEGFLVEHVAEFLAEGVREGEPCIVIATPEHNAAFDARLRSLGIDTGRIIYADARATLERFLDRGMPDAQRFRRVVGGALRKAGGAAGHVRAYGEMVDLLWRDGEPDAAIRLEELWNDLAHRQTFSLLCAYPMGNFYKESDRAAFEKICETHTLVRPTERSTGADDRDRRIALLEQRATVLEQEITHRKQLEQRLSESLAARRRGEELLRDFVDNATIGLHWVTADGTIEWANEAELKLLGYGPGEYIGHDIREFHADPRAIDDILCRLGGNEEIHDYEAPLRAKDGSIRWVAISSNVFYENGSFVHTRCFSRDITDRKRLEEQNAFLLDATAVLTRSVEYEARLRALADVVVPRLADWCVVDIARDESYDRLATSHSDATLAARGAKLHELWRATPQTDPVMTVLRTGEPLIADEPHLDELSPLGIGSWMIVPMIVAGRVIGTLTLVTADSGRRYTERDLPLALDLAARAAGAVELARLYQIAQTNNRAKDEFLATLSHELRTPLTAILGWARMLSFGGLDENTLRIAVATIEQSARTQASLVNDLLDVSRIVSGKLSLQSDPVDLTGVAESVFQTMQVAADAKRIRLELSGLHGRAIVKGDSTRLQQIVWNLVSNAIKFSDPDAKVHVRLEHDAESARIIVRDEGRGIEPSFLPLVFEPFRQADSSSTRHFGGLGLGLAIVKYLAEAHGGTVCAESAGAGQGSTFTVTLPLAHRSARVPLQLQELPDLAGTSVLVVDDDEGSRRMLNAALRRCGADVDCVDSVAAARDSLVRRRPHVIITDLAMPGEDGLALLQHVRGESGVPRISVIALTGAQQQHTVQAEFDAFMNKPCDPLEIARSVAGVRQASENACEG